MSRGRYIKITGLVTALLVCCNATGDSSSQLPSIVDERIDAMKAMKRNTKLLADMVRARTEFNVQDFRQAARGIADGAPLIPEMFPAGSLTPPSNALPAIWEQRDKFDRLSVQLTEAAQPLITHESSDTLATAKKQFRQLGRVCAACHKQFRKKKEKK